MSIDELVAEHAAQIAAHGVQISRISSVLGVEVSASSPRVCPGCGRPVVPAGDGSLPPHQIDGAVLGRGRRTNAVCRYRPQVVA